MGGQNHADSGGVAFIFGTAFSPFKNQRVGQKLATACKTIDIVSPAHTKKPCFGEVKQYASAIN